MRWIIVILAVLMCGLACAQGAPDFNLREYLGHTWRNERVTFPLNEAQGKRAKAGHALVGLDGKAVLYQPVTAEGKPAIVFLTDLEPFDRREFRFTEKKSDAPTDLKVEETADSVTITTGQIGIRLAKTAAGGTGPIGGIRLASGKWVGGSVLSSDLPVKSYSVTVTQRGPVFAEAIVRATLGENSAWAMRVQVVAGEPVVLFDEKCAVTEGKDTRFRLLLNNGFAPDSVLYRLGKGAVGQNATSKLAPDEKEPAFTLEAWLHWWERDRQGPCASFYAENGPDMLGIAGRESSVWIDPKLAPEQQAPIRVPIMLDAQGLRMELAIKQGQRKWMLMTPDKAASLAAVADDKAIWNGSLPHRLLVKYGHFPLDMVKDFTLEWAGDHQNYPRLFVTKADLPKLKARLQGQVEQYQKDLPTYRKEINYYAPDGPIGAYLATGDLELGQRIEKTALEWTQGAVNNFLEQTGSCMYGLGPSQGSAVPTALAAADIALSDPTLPQPERERLLAQAAFLGYAMNRKDYWWPEVGYAANPNMTTSVEGYKTTVACLIPSHPLAKTWAAASLKELKAQVDGWSDDNGGWLEAPHYAMVSYDPILAAFLMAKNAGFADYVFDPKMKKVALWFAKITTPPDSRIGGYRHFPPIGNTYLNEPTGEFGVLAGIWKEKDPEFAANMQWMHQQINRYAQPGIGGAYPGLAAFRSLLRDETIQAKAPNWGSELFPETSVVLRSGFNTPRETQLYMIAGRNHLHYDQDTGAVLVWGLGRILADDFGYYGNIPPEDHNVLESVVARNNATMKVQQFVPGVRADFVRGQCEAWTRQVAFIKHNDPTAPDYFVIADTLDIPAPATWRLWCTANRVAINDASALVDGKEDVDMDVYFARPAGVTLTTEARTRRSVSGLFPDWHWGPMESTQQGIIAPMTKSTGTLVVLYPRMKGAPTPTVTPIADGKGVKVQFGGLTDYVFLSAREFTFKGDGISFNGTAGMAQLRGKESFTALGSAGDLFAPGAAPISSVLQWAKETASLFPNGDFENGQLGLFPAESSLLKFRVAPNPIADPNHAGKQCLAADFAGPRTAFGAQGMFYMDATKTYRISMNILIKGNFSVEVGGYGSDGKNPNLRTDDGRVWQWGFSKKGPTEGWTPLACTVGPKGSGADVIFPEGILSTHMTFWITGEAGTFYIDDVKIEEVAGK